MYAALCVYISLLNLVLLYAVNNVMIHDDIRAIERARVCRGEKSYLREYRHQLQC